MPALMDHDGAEAAFAITPSVGREGKSDGVERGPALLLVEGMHIPGIRQLVNPVEGIAGEWKLGRIVDQITGVLPLVEPFGRERIRVLIKSLKHPDEQFFIPGHIAMVRKFDIRTRKVGHCFRKLSADVTYSPDRSDVLLTLESFRKLQNALLGHSVGQNVGLGVKEDGSSDRIRPGIIMGDASEACFNAAQNDGPGLFEKAPDEIAVNDDRPVRTFCIQPARGQIVAFAPFGGSGVISDHGVDATGGDAPEKRGFPQPGNIPIAVNVGLGDNADPVACVQ